jgi:hypothetical protein
MVSRVACSVGGTAVFNFFPSRRLIRARQRPGSRSYGSIRYPLYSFMGNTLLRELKPRRASFDCAHKTYAPVREAQASAARGCKPCAGADRSESVICSGPPDWRVFCHEVRIDSIRPCRRLAARGLVGEPDVCRPDLAADEALNTARKPDFAFGRPPNGKNTPANSSRKCSNAECFLK